MDKMTKQDWLSKAQWEGGLYEALSYGLTHKDLDPNDDPDFYADVKEIVEALASVHDAVERVEAEMEELNE